MALPHFTGGTYITIGEYYKLICIGDYGVIAKCIGDSNKGKYHYMWEFEIDGEEYIEEYSKYIVKLLTKEEKIKFFREKGLKSLDI